MDINLPKEILNLGKKFKDAGFQLYVVGGAIRDLLMHREATDWDFTTDAKPEEILKILPDGFYNNQFGTVGLSIKNREKSEPAKVVGAVDQQTISEPRERANGTLRPDNRGLNEQDIFEITTMRKEGEYEDYRHPTEVSWTDKIEEDLARRDFTVNAMALSVPPPTSHLSPPITDPFNGQKDLEQKLIKTVGDPEKRFKEDALRLIRAVRFTTELRFLIEEKTFEAIKQNASLIKQISWERITGELFKILSTDYPYEGILMLRNTGLLEYILPEVERGFGIVQEGPKHDRTYDIGEHSLLSLKFCPSKDPLVRLAALIHDIGKPDTIKVQEDGNVTFYGHDVVGGRLAKKVGERLRLSNKQIDKLIRLVRWHMFSVNEFQTDSAVRRFIKNVGLENIDDMMAVRIGDRLGGGTQKEVSWRMEEFRKRIDEVMKKPFSISDLKVTGTDVMETLNIKPGPKVGEILNNLFREVLEDASKNNREYLLERIRTHSSNQSDTS